MTVLALMIRTISLNLVILMLEVNFVSEFTLELTYISLFINIKSDLTHSPPWFLAACAAAIVYRSHFFVSTNKINLLNLK